VKYVPHPRHGPRLIARAGFSPRHLLVGVTLLYLSTARKRAVSYRVVALRNAGRWPRTSAAGATPTAVVVLEDERGRRACRLADTLAARVDILLLQLVRLVVLLMVA
jgi:hypothetical protein